MTLKDDASPASTDWTDPKIPTATEQFVYQVAAKTSSETALGPTWRTLVPRP